MAFLDTLQNCITAGRLFIHFYQITFLRESEVILFRICLKSARMRRLVIVHFFAVRNACLGLIS